MEKQRFFWVLLVALGFIGTAEASFQDDGKNKTYNRVESVPIQDPGTGTTTTPNQYSQNSTYYDKLRLGQTGGTEQKTSDQTKTTTYTSTPSTTSTYTSTPATTTTYTSTPATTTTYTSTPATTTTYTPAAETSYTTGTVTTSTNTYEAGTTYTDAASQQSYNTYEATSKSRAGEYTTATAETSYGGYDTGLTYRVQIGAFSKILADDHQFFYNLHENESLYFDSSPTGLTRYVVGDFNSYQDAMNYSLSLQSRGYDRAFIVAYGSDGNRVAIQKQ